MTAVLQGAVNVRFISIYSISLSCRNMIWKTCYREAVFNLLAVFGMLLTSCYKNVQNLEIVVN